MGWALGQLKASARGSRVIGGPRQPATHHKCTVTNFSRSSYCSRFSFRYRFRSIFVSVKRNHTTRGCTWLVWRRVRHWVRGQQRNVVIKSHIDNRRLDLLIYNAPCAKSYFDVRCRWVSPAPGPLGTRINQSATFYSGLSNQDYYRIYCYTTTILYPPLAYTLLSGVGDRAFAGRRCPCLERTIEVMPCLNSASSFRPGTWVIIGHFNRFCHLLTYWSADDRSNAKTEKFSVDARTSRWVMLRRHSYIYMISHTKCRKMRKNEKRQVPRLPSPMQY